MNGVPPGGNYDGGNCLAINEVGKVKMGIRSWFCVLVLQALSSGVVEPVLCEEQNKILSELSPSSVIFLRHARTEPDQKDTDPSDVQECSRQRNLSAAGQEQAVAIGEEFRRRGIKVGEVVASPFCRTRDTAELAFGKVRWEFGLLDIGAITKGVASPQSVEALLKLLTTDPKGGSNSVVVGHLPTFQALTGIELREGEGAVVDPAASRKEGKVVVLGRFYIGD